MYIDIFIFTKPSILFSVLSAECAIFVFTKVTNILKSKRHTRNLALNTSCMSLVLYGGDDGSITRNPYFSSVNFTIFKRT